MTMVFTSDIKKMLAKYGKKIKTGKEAEACKRATEFLYDRRERGLSPRYEMALIDLLKDITDNL